MIRVYNYIIHHLFHPFYFLFLFGFSLILFGVFSRLGENTEMMIKLQKDNKEQIKNDSIYNVKIGEMMLEIQNNTLNIEKKLKWFMNLNYVEIIGVVISFMALVGLYINSKSKAKNREDDKMNDLDTRITEIETRTTLELKALDQKMDLGFKNIDIRIANMERERTEMMEFNKNHFDRQEKRFDKQDSLLEKIDSKMDILSNGFIKLKTEHESVNCNYPKRSKYSEE